MNFKKENEKDSSPEKSHDKGKRIQIHANFDELFSANCPPTCSTKVQRSLEMDHCSKFKIWWKNWIGIAGCCNMFLTHLRFAEPLPLLTLTHCVQSVQNLQYIYVSTMYGSAVTQYDTYRCLNCVLYRTVSNRLIFSLFPWCLCQFVASAFFTFTALLSVCYSKYNRWILIIFSI